MSNPLYRKYTIQRSAHEQLVIPRAQMIGLRWARTDAGQEYIEFRLSVGRVTLFGEQLDDLWVKLVSGEMDIVDFGKPLEQGQLTKLETDLLWSFVEPRVKPALAA
jgi:hypothetical protein